METWMIASIAAGAILVLCIAVYIIRMVSKKKKADKIAANKQAAEQSAYMAKLKEETQAAKEFSERRSVNLKEIEENRRVAGASAVTGKENIVK